MKKYIFLLCLLTTTCLAGIQAQSNGNIPANVKSGFEKKYPNQQAAWSKAKHGYVARFDEHGLRAIVHFNKMGQLTQRGWYITHSELPEAAMLYLNKYYPEKSSEGAFTDILKSEDVHGNISYKVHLNGKELLFDSKGVFIKYQKQKE